MKKNLTFILQNKRKVLYLYRKKQQRMNREQLEKLADLLGQVYTHLAAGFRYLDQLGYCQTTNNLK